MGQKVHPTGFRLGITKDHNSVWYAGSDTYSEKLLNDIEVRRYLEKKLEKERLILCLLFLEKKLFKQ